MQLRLCLWADGGCCAEWCKWGEDLDAAACMAVKCAGYKWLVHFDAACMQPMLAVDGCRAKPGMKRGRRRVHRNIVTEDRDRAAPALQLAHTCNLIGLLLGLLQATAMPGGRRR